MTRLVAADPGLRRMRAAAQVIVAVALAVGITLPVLAALGQPSVAVAPAAVVATVSLLAVRDGGRRGVLTTLLMPVPAIVSFALAAFTRGSPLLGELVFLAVMFAAVYIRRFGEAAFAAGMAAFMSFFLALLLQVSFATLPAMAGAAVLGACCAVLSRFVLLREHPDRAWRSAVRALRARITTLLHAVDDLGEQPDSAQRRGRVHDELLRLNATALSLGSGYDALNSLPQEQADELRGRVLDVELAAGALVAAVDGLLGQPVEESARPAVARVTEALYDDVECAAEVSRDVADRLDGAGSPAVGMAVRRLAAAAADLSAASAAMPGAPNPGPPAAPDEPVEAAGPPQAAEDEGPRGLRPTTRTAVQVVVAGALSIVVGNLVAPGQWYWAVITAFVVFAAAASRGELLVRTSARVVGTLCGVVAGAAVAILVSGHLVLQVAVVLVCMFLGFYLLPVSYALMTFFVTTMIGVLYSLLGRFSIGFLEIRLVETVVGAAAGAVAALIVLPIRTWGVVADRAKAFHSSVAGLLRSAAEDLGAGAGAGVRPLAASAREVDDRMHALLAGASPLGSFRFGEGQARYQRWRQLVSSCAAATRAFARTVPVAAATSDPDTRARLGELATAVADLAEAAGPADGRAATALAARAYDLEETLVDVVEALHAGPTALRAAIGQLGRLRGVLADLSREFGSRLERGEAPAAGRRRHH
ncbi:MAG TPA: FUSC family protein [Pseudonocardia sp.]|nr:FUSC family protein [Pseudonocardia sp.]